MATVHKLATSGGTLVDFTDQDKYRALRQGASFTKPRKRILVDLYTGTTKYALSYKTTAMCRFNIVSMGSDYQDALDNFNDIESALDTARLFNATGAGLQVNYTEQWFNQTVPDEWHVIDGDVLLETRDLVAVEKIIATLTLYLTKD